MDCCHGFPWLSLIVLMVFRDCFMIFFSFYRLVQWFSCIFVDFSTVFLDFSMVCMFLRGFVHCFS